MIVARIRAPSALQYFATILDTGAPSLRGFVLLRVCIISKKEQNDDGNVTYRRAPIAYSGDFREQD